MPLVPQSTFAAAPRVYVIRVDAVHNPGLDAFLNDEGFPAWKTSATRPSEIIPEVCGRLCYLSFAGGRDHPAYVENLKRERHGSVLEHASITFILTGVSRTFTHELVRHRAGWAFSQLSQRYVDESYTQVVCPAAVAVCKGDPVWNYIHAAWLRAAADARDAYRYLLAELEVKFNHENSGGGTVRTACRKFLRGAARSLLAGCTETKIACTVNARALRHFLEMRASPGADLEIRSVALLIYHAAFPFMPDILGDYEVAVADDGHEYLRTKYLKV